MLVLMVAYLLTVPILLFNMLIAQLARSFTEVQQEIQQEYQYIFSRDVMESQEAPTAPSTRPSPSGQPASRGGERPRRCASASRSASSWQAGAAAWPWS